MGTDFIWGVVDINPDTDYPDVRNLGVVHSSEGSALLIPREGDLLRLYVQLSDADVIDPQTGRLDKARASPEKVLNMARKILRPYRIDPIGDIRWWTMYVGTSYPFVTQRHPYSGSGQWDNVSPTGTRSAIASSFRAMLVTLIRPRPVRFIHAVSFSCKLIRIQVKE